MLANLITALLAFTATNIDDIFILMLFYGNRTVKQSHIIAGQFLGIGTLVVISLVGAFIGDFVDQRYVGLLGLFPIYLAIKHTTDLIKNKNRTREEGHIDMEATGFIAIAGVTIANGGDNLGVYIPLLTTMTTPEKIQLIIVFCIMTYVWCLTARYLASRRLIARKLDKYGHIIMPIVLFLLGLFILWESESMSLLASLNGN